MNGKEYLIKQIQDSSEEEIIRVAIVLNMCANEFLPKSFSNGCTYNETNNIEECKNCWNYALHENY